MAIRTRRFDVFAEQCKIREVMVKAVLVKQHDVGVPAFVIYVTIGTGPAARSPVKTVKSRLGIDVCVDILVTVQAKRALLRALECLVTRATFGLEFRMSLDDITRHHQRFDLGSGSFGYE